MVEVEVEVEVYARYWYNGVMSWETGAGRSEFDEVGLSGEEAEAISGTVEHRPGRMNVTIFIARTSSPTRIPSSSRTIHAYNYHGRATWPISTNSCKRGPTMATTSLASRSCGA